MIPLIDFQYEIGGVVLGTNTPFLIAEVEGLDPVELRTADVEPPDEDGTWLGVDRFQGRLIRMDAGIRMEGDPGAVMDQLGQLTALIADETVRAQGGVTADLRIKWPGRPVRVVRGRLRRAKATLAQAVHGWAPLDIAFQGADHLFYGEEPQSVSIPLGLISTAGFTAPIVPPVTVGGAGPEARPGRIDVDGTTATWPLLTIHGPCTNPVITHVGSGRVLALPGTVGAGEWVEIDTRPTRRSVTRSGGGITSLLPVSRIDAFRLPPGPSEIHWTASDPTASSSLAVTWWPAYTAL